MKLFIICFLFICLFSFQSVVLGYVRPQEKYFSNDSITYIFKKGDTYFTSWNFYKTNTILNFSCKVNQNQDLVTICIASIGEKEITKKFTHVPTVCIKKEDPIFLEDCSQTLLYLDYPQPIINPQFIPLTKGGIEYLQGIFIYFGKTESNEFILLGDNMANPTIVDKPSSPIFDYTNIKLDYKGGCGSCTFMWESGGNYTFIHARQSINKCTPSGSDKIIIKGSNFCSMEHYGNITVTVNGNVQPILNITYDTIEIQVTNETYLQHNLTIVVTIYGVKSDEYMMQPTFHAVTNVQYPSVNGQKVVYTINNIDDYNKDADATFKINDTFIPYQDVSSLVSKSRNYTLSIPTGCGKKEMIISVGNQTTPFVFYYQTPRITGCNVIGNIELNDAMVVCNGNFTDFKSYYLNNDIDIQLSNTIFDSKFNISDSSLSFELKSEYQTGDISICGVNVSSIIIKPKLIKPIDKLMIFNSKGGILTINGYNFNEVSISKTNFNCKNIDYENNVKCLYVSQTEAICEFTVTGPRDLNCDFIFDGVLNDSITIGFSNHTVLNVTNQVSLKDGGTITIIGTEFYDNIEKITLGNRICIEPLYINDKEISCTINTNNENIEFLPNIYVNVIIGGKNSGAYLLIYYNNESTSIGVGSGGTILFYDYFKWMFIVLIVAIVIIGLIIYRFRNQILNKLLKIKK